MLVERYQLPPAWPRALVKPQGASEEQPKSSIWMQLLGLAHSSMTLAA